MKVSKKLLGSLVLGVALATGATYAHNADVSAATTYLGTDWAKYQGNNGIVGPNDEFAIAQIGGTYSGQLNVQSTYGPQIKSARAKGLRAHTYIWYEVGSNQTVAKNALDYFLPRVQTPKGSIVALDYESGASGNKAANTEAVLYGMRRVKSAGYTPLLYSGQVYLNTHLDVKKILASFPNSLWVARYPDYSVSAKPNFNYFPTMDGVAIWQFTSMHVAGGLDGNVDLLGVTFNGYKGSSVAPSKPSTPSKPSAPAAKMTQSNYVTTGVVNGGTRLFYYTNSGMTVGPAATYGTYKTLKKGVLNGQTYYLLSKDGKKAYAWVPAGSLRAPVNNAMATKQYRGVANVRGGYRLYYNTNAGLTNGPVSVAGSYAVMGVGTKSGKTYYLLSKDGGKKGYAWAPAAAVSFNPGSNKLVQSAFTGAATVKKGSATYYATNAGLTPANIATGYRYNIIKKATFQGQTYYLLSKNGKSGLAWTAASSLVF